MSAQLGQRAAGRSKPGLLTGSTHRLRVGGKGERNHSGAGGRRGLCLDGAARARVPKVPSPRAVSLCEIRIHGPVGTRPHAAEASLVERVSPDRRDRRTVHLQARVTDHLGCIDSSRRLPQQDSMREGQMFPNAFHSGRCALRLPVAVNNRRFACLRSAYACLLVGTLTLCHAKEPGEQKSARQHRGAIGISRRRGHQAHSN